MRILLDTNILIHREASTVINEDIGTLFNWLDKLKYEKCYHPLSLEEIRTHTDSKVVKTMEIKLKNYNELKTLSPDSPGIEEIRKNDKSRNDEIDTSIVNEVYNKRVDFLITEDRGIHSKAKGLGIGEKVFKIDAFLEKVVAENPDLTDYKVLAVRKEYFGNINIDDHFFDSFKTDYSGFEAWFNKKSDKQAYICLEDEDIKAFLYIKKEEEDESYTDISPSFTRKKRLKIGTLKVISTGYKLGERFLKIIFDNALLLDVEEIYVTIFEKREEQSRLISLLTDWGFSYWGEKSTSDGNEKVYVRDFSRKANLSKPRLSFPFISRQCQKHIVPIYPPYHTELFPDSILTNESPDDFQENEPYRNAIKKIYISRSFKRNLKSGDLIVFYRTGGYYKGVVSTLGVVENVIHSIRDENHFIQLCRKRSVFDDDGLREFWNYNPRNRPFIVNFLYVTSFPTPKVNLKSLITAGIILKAPRGFEPLSDQNFDTLLKLANANESNIVN